MPKIYLDYAAATPLDPTVKREVLHGLGSFGNASSLHWAGQAAKKIVEQARVRSAAVLHCRPNEVVFTNSGTEADNLAVLGVARARRDQGRHIITSAIEHPAVGRACQQLEREGFLVTYLSVDKNGRVSPEQVKKALRPDTSLVSIMYANGEIGTIQSIKEIAKIIRQSIGGKPKPVFHTDAAQAAGALSLDVQKLGVDLLSLNGAKIYGPQATGCLCVRRGIRIEPLLFGGGQEEGRRPGTPNPALLAGLATALVLAEKRRKTETTRLTKLRDYFIKQILSTIPKTRLNGDPVQRLPNNINLSFRGVDGEMLVLALSQKGIAVSTGSACTTGHTGPSLVLQAIGVPAAWGNLRITLGRATTKAELNYTLNILTKLVRQLHQ